MKELDEKYVNLISAYFQGIKIESVAGLHNEWLVTLDILYFFELNEMYESQDTVKTNFFLGQMRSLQRRIISI